jgi:hypothetical protein
VGERRRSTGGGASVVVAVLDLKLERLDLANPRRVASAPRRTQADLVNCCPTLAAGQDGQGKDPPAPYPASHGEPPRPSSPQS